MRLLFFLYFGLPHEFRIITVQSGSAEFYRRRYSLGWLYSLAKGDYGKNEAFHWKKVFDDYCESGTYTYPQLCNNAAGLLAIDTGENALDLIKDPVEYPFDTQSHISALDYEADPVVTALKAAEAIARELGKLRGELSPVYWAKIVRAVTLKVKRALYRYVG